MKHMPIVLHNYILGLQSAGGYVYTLPREEK
jgi:hypothetical protein